MGSIHPGAMAVHRLDAGVSGLVVFAKTGGMRRKLKNELKAQKAKKVYVARVLGDVPADTDTNVAVDMDFQDGRGVITRSGEGKHTETRVRYLRSVRPSDGEVHSLVECMPK